MNGRDGSPQVPVHPWIPSGSAVHGLGCTARFRSGVRRNGRGHGPRAHRKDSVEPNDACGLIASDGERPSGLLRGQAAERIRVGPVRSAQGQIIIGHRGPSPPLVPGGAQRSGITHHVSNGPPGRGRAREATLRTTQGRGSLTSWAWPRHGRTCGIEPWISARAVPNAQGNGRIVRTCCRPGSTCCWWLSRIRLRISSRHGRAGWFAFRPGTPRLH
jgi:hypothetical protein